MITVTLSKEYRKLRPNFPFVFNQGINFVFGPNGSGKSTLISILLASIQSQNKKLVPEELWNAYDATIIPRTGKSILEVTGTENISQLRVSSAKLRQSQFVDLGVTMAMGISRLQASEGENSLHDIHSCLKLVDDPNALFLFDELDTHLDYKMKYFFFTRFLSRLRGTIIVTSHDSFFLMDQPVFDLTDYKTKLGREYYREQILALSAPKPSVTAK